MVEKMKRKSGMAAVLAAGCLAMTSSLSFGATTNDYPQWWIEKGLVNTNIAQTNDFALLTAGQFKWWMTNAYDELTNITNGAGSELESYIAGFQNSNNYSVVNIGQLKHAASLFYDRFYEEELITNRYPWCYAEFGGSDFKPANIGQLKYLFSFDLRSSPKQAYPKGFEPPDLDGKDISMWNMMSAIPSHSYSASSGTVVMSACVTIDHIIYNDSSHPWDRFFLSSEPDSAGGWNSTGLIFVVNGTEKTIPAGNSLDVTEFIQPGQTLHISLKYTGGGTIAMDKTGYLLRWSPRSIKYKKFYKDSPYVSFTTPYGTFIPHETVGLKAEVELGTAIDPPYNGAYNMYADFVPYGIDGGASSCEMEGWSGIRATAVFDLSVSGYSIYKDDCSVWAHNHRNAEGWLYQLGHTNFSMYGVAGIYLDENSAKYFPCDVSNGWSRSFWVDLNPHDASVTGQLSFAIDGADPVGCGYRAGGSNDVSIAFSNSATGTILRGYWNVYGITSSNSITIVEGSEHLYLVSEESDTNRQNGSATLCSSGTVIQILDPYKYWDGQDAFKLSWTNPPERLIAIDGDTNMPKYVHYDSSTTWPITMNLTMLATNGGPTTNTVLTVPVLQIAMTHSNAPPCSSLLNLDHWIDLDIQDGTAPMNTNDSSEADFPGKLIAVNNNDDDADGIPDFIDGFNWHEQGSNYISCTNESSFVPLLITLPQAVNLSDMKLLLTLSGNLTSSIPWDATISAPAEGNIRLWRKDGNETRTTNDYVHIATNGAYFACATNLGTWTNNQIYLYLEGVNAGSGTISVAVGPTDYEGYFWTDTVAVTVIKVDLDTDTDNDGTIDADDSGEDAFEEYAPGRILPVNGYGIDSNTDYLAEIKLAIPNITSGTAKLEALTNGSCIKVWTTTNKTTEVTLPKTYDLTTTNLPTSLYVDGINTGKVILALSYTNSSGFAYTDKVAMLIIPTISYAPVSSNAYVWSSLPSLGIGDGTEFQNQIKDEGFKVTWFSDSTGASDTNFEDCTLANYKNMTNAGAFTVISHGAEGKHLVVYAEDTTNGQAACNAWRGAETNMVTKHEISFGWYVEVSSKWLVDNWQNGMNANRTIAMWSICYSATDNPGEGEASVKEAAGGRWRSGYELPVSMQEAIDVNSNLLGRINGSISNGMLRTAGQAYSNLNYRTFRNYAYDDDNDLIVDRNDGSVKMDGNDWTTLCSAPIFANAVFPDTTAGNRKGWGCIIFDTYMCTTNAASDALTKQSGCPTSDHRWFGNANGTYGLGFDFDKTGGAATTMRAIADKCRNDGGAEDRRMDGDRIKPNNDNRDWSF